jgi:putative transposase
VSQTFTLSKGGSRWFILFWVDAERLPVQQPTSSVGIDVGIKSFAMLSNQQVFDAQKPLIACAKTKLAILQGQTSRQVKGYNKGRKTYNKISRLHAQIACPACGRSVDRDLNASMNILNCEPSAVGR